MRLFLFFFFLFLLNSCKKEVATSGICHDINEELDLSYYVHDTIKVDINNDENPDIIFYSYSWFAQSTNGSYRTVAPASGYELAYSIATKVSWVYDPVYYPDTSFTTQNFTIAKKNLLGDTIISDTTFTTNGVGITSSSGGGAWGDNFVHGGSNSNPWFNSTVGYIAFRNQSLGIIGWIRLDANKAIAKYYFIENSTELIVDENVCQ